MNCRLTHNLLFDYLSGELAGEELRALETHVASCADCRAKLDGWRETFESVSTLAAPVNPPPEVKQALLARIRSGEMDSATIPLPARTFALEPVVDPAATAPDASTARRRIPGKFRHLWYVAAMLGGLLLGAAGTRFWWLETSRDGAGNGPAEIAIADYRLQRALEQGMRGIQGADWHLTSFSAPPVAEVPNDSHTPGPRKSALLGWDAASGEIHFYALGLKSPPAGVMYRLWLVDDQDQWTPVGELKAETDVYQLLAKAPLPWRQELSFVVTQEDAHAAPTREHGPIVLHSDSK